LLVPDTLVHRAVAWRRTIARLPRWPRAAFNALAFVLLVGLVVAGLTGSRDPLSNPLPLTGWTLWWVGLTLAQALLGDLWAVLNPWVAPYRLLRRFDHAGARPGAPPLCYPASLGYWPAALGFLLFAWFELIDP